MGEEVCASGSSLGADRAVVGVCVPCVVCMLGAVCADPPSRSSIEAVGLATNQRQRTDSSRRTNGDRVDWDDGPDPLDRLDGLVRLDRVAAASIVMSCAENPVRTGPTVGSRVSGSGRQQYRQRVRGRNHQRTARTRLVLAYSWRSDDQQPSYTLYTVFGRRNCHRSRQFTAFRAEWSKTAAWSGQLDLTLSRPKRDVSRPDGAILAILLTKDCDLMLETYRNVSRNAPNSTECVPIIIPLGEDARVLALVPRSAGLCSSKAIRESSRPCYVEREVEW